jgi:hypothetical protein
MNIFRVLQKIGAVFYCAESQSTATGAVWGYVLRVIKDAKKTNSKGKKLGMKRELDS